MPAFDNRPMMFWEVVSAFREQPQIVRSVLTAPQWKAPYAAHLEAFESLVGTQRRDVLDQRVPLQLTRQICEQLPDLYVLWPDSKHLRRYRTSSAAYLYVLWPDSKHLRRYRTSSAAYLERESLAKLTALDVHERYGPAVLEEVREYGSATVA